METQERNYPEMNMDELMAQEYATERAIIRLKNKGMSYPMVWKEELDKTRADMELLEDNG